MNTKKEVETSTPEYCITIGTQRLESMENDPYAYATMLEILQEKLTSGKRVTFEEELDTITGIDSVLFGMMHDICNRNTVEFENRLMEVGRDVDGITIVVKTKSTVSIDCVEYL